MQKTVLVDDLDGRTTKDVQTVQFTDTEGNRWEIDLSPVHAKALRRELAEFVSHARKATAATKRQPARLRAVRPAATKVRAWAKSKGYEVKDRGRVPDEYYVLYSAAA